MRRWDQFHVDHRKYEEAYHDCSEWQKDVASQVKAASSTDGDKVSLLNKQARLQQLAATCKDDGFQRLQQVQDQAHVVLPNTSTPGKDVINEDLYALRHDWDDVMTLLSEGRVQVEAALSAWEAHTDTLAGVRQWLTDMDARLRDEGQLKATLPEKRSQLERVKVTLIHC